MLDYALLSALAAVVRTGSFERAAQQLHVTASAVSQRVKLLEERMGVVLVARGSPCTATLAGLRLCQHAEQVALFTAKVEALTVTVGQITGDAGALAVAGLMSPLLAAVLMPLSALTVFTFTQLSTRGSR